MTQANKEAQDCCLKSSYRIARKRDPLGQGTYGISWIAGGNVLYRIPLEAGMETGWARGWPRVLTLRVCCSSSMVKPDEPEKERFVEV